MWFTIGTLRELALAIKDCRAALAKRGMLDAQSAPWVKLREVEDRWERDETFRRMRNTAAFHVDQQVIAAGLATMVADHRDVFLSRGEGSKSVRSSLTLGLEAMHNGLGMGMEAYGQFLEQVNADHGVVGDSVQEAFILAVKTAGISFGD